MLQRFCRTKTSTSFVPFHFSSQIVPFPFLYTTNRSVVTTETRTFYSGVRWIHISGGSENDALTAQDKVEMRSNEISIEPPPTSTSSSSSSPHSDNKSNNDNNNNAHNPFQQRSEQITNSEFESSFVPVNKSDAIFSKKVAEILSELEIDHFFIRKMQKRNVLPVLFWNPQGDSSTFCFMCRYYIKDKVVDETDDEMLAKFKRDASSRRLQQQGISSIFVGMKKFVNYRFLMRLIRKKLKNGKKVTTTATTTNTSSKKVKTKSKIADNNNNNSDSSIERLDTIESVCRRISFYVTPSMIVTVSRYKLDFIQQLLEKFSYGHEFEPPLSIVFSIISNCTKTFEVAARHNLIVVDQLESLFAKQELIQEHHQQLLLALHRVSRRASVAISLLPATLTVFSDLCVALRAKSEINIKNADTAKIEIVTRQIDSAHELHRDVQQSCRSVMTLIFAENAAELEELTRILTCFSAFFIPISLIATLLGADLEILRPFYETGKLGFYFSLTMMMMLGIFTSSYLTRNGVVTFPVLQKQQQQILNRSRGGRVSTTTRSR